MHYLVRDMIKFEKEENSMDEYSKDLFEKKLKEHFQFFYKDNLAEFIAFNNYFCKPFNPVDKM